jgi:hypothetical protein
MSQDISTRRADIEELNRAMRSGDQTARICAERAYNKINHESGAVKSMREALIKAHRQGNQAEIKDIHDYVTTHAKYK